MLIFLVLPQSPFFFFLRGCIQDNKIITTIILFFFSRKKRHTDASLGLVAWGMLKKDRVPTPGPGEHPRAAPRGQQEGAAVVELDRMA